VVSFTPRSFYPCGKSPRYPLDRRLDGPHSRCGQLIERRKILPLLVLKLRPLGRPVRSQPRYRLIYLLSPPKCFGPTIPSSGLCHTTANTLPVPDTSVLHIPRTTTKVQSSTLSTPTPSMRRQHKARNEPP
jgi:hypothetical protein